MTLDRFCNLVYYTIVRNMTTEDRQKLDSELSRAETVTSQTHRTSSGSATPTVNGRKPPAWWKGDSAAQSSIQAARDMGLAVGPVGRIK